MRLLNRITKAKANAKADCDAQANKNKKRRGWYTWHPFLEGFYFLSYEI